MRANPIAAIILAQLLIYPCVCAQQRGGGVRVAGANADGSARQFQLYDGSYALVIGNSEYKLGWGRLAGVKSDIAAVRGVLERHGFKVEVEKNLTSDRFESRVRKFINDYGYDRDNRLLVYYAGHGYTLNSVGDERDLGYVIPSDAPLPTKDGRGFRQKAVSMYAIQSFARDIQAKHALFVFDSCFSGKLFALREPLKITPFIVEKVNHPVRQFITAGDETQTVPDDSIFRKAFVRGLEGDADRNKDTYITGTELADYLIETVTNYTNRRLTPQYGTINDINLDRGDTVFAVPGGAALDAAPRPGAAPRLSAADVEHEYWAEIKNSTDVGDFRLYKERYPNGIYTNLADLKIQQLTRAAARPNSTPSNAAGSLPVFRREVQDEIVLEAIRGANGKYGYKNKANGTIVVEPKYDAAYSFNEGLANVRLNGKEGYINQRGEVVIPLIYDDVQVSFSEGLAKVSRGGKWGFIDKNNNEVIQIKYDEAWWYYGGKAKVKLHGKVGFIDKAEKVVVPFNYEGLGIPSEGLVGAKLDGKWGFIDEADNVVIPFRYDHVWSFHGGLANVQLGGKQGYIDKAGNVIIPFRYDDVSTQFFEGLSRVKLNRKYGFIDKTGRQVIPIQYDEAELFSRGKAKVKRGGREFYIDKEGNEVAAP
jgi:uncharacterized caspase-like protein